MNKILNKIISFMAVLVIVFGCGFLLTGCNSENASRVMNLSVNPSIELLLDANNRVISVSANNDEGNFIVANAKFIGLSAEDAVDLFLEINYENGFIVKGSAATGENKLDIEISGDEAINLFNSLKDSANEYLAQIDANVQINLNEVLNRDDLEELVEECMQELSETQINQLSEQELLDLIKNSREETKSFLTEELKDLYYETRAEEIVKQKFETIVSELEKMFALPGFDLSEILSQFNQNIGLLSQNLKAFKAGFKTQFLNASSEYQTEMKQYIEAKKALLEARVNEAVDTASLEEALASAEAALENAKTSADELLESFDEAIDEAIENLNSVLNQIARFLSEKNINSAIEQARVKFNSNFKNEFEEYIDNNYWENLKPETTVA